MRPAATVRRASVADVERVAELFSRYREFYGQPADVGAAAEFLRERLELDQSIVFVAEAENGATVGFAQIYPTFTSVELRHAWRLNDLYVAEGARRAGVGEALLRAAAASAAAAAAVWIDLETARDNAAAQRLYEREGYGGDEVYIHYTKEL